MESTQFIEILLSIISLLGAGLIAIILYIYRMVMSKIKATDSAMESLHKKLTAHEESMGKAGKAIHGDMLEVQKEFNKLKVDFSDKIIEVNKQMSNLKIEANELVSSLKMSTERFDDKYNRISEVEGEVKAVKEKIEEQGKK